MSTVEYPYIWYWRARMPERKGERCRILARGRKNTVAVEFASDGHLVFTSGFAVRKPTLDRGGRER